MFIRPLFPLPQRFPRKALVLALGVALMPALAHAADAGAVAAPSSATATAVDASKSQSLGTVYVTGNTVNTLAPSAPPLEATQPTSVIDERFIRDALRYNANYDDIVKYSPSMTVTSPEGPGLGKNEGISLRGFQDGQFNITFDGIPFGDASDFHHTTSAYFSNHVLGQAQIDRGPGGGSTIGNATFGGTIGLRSRDPSLVDGFTPYLTIGSWNTQAGGLSLDQHYGDTGVFLEASKESSDTFLKNTEDDRGHLFAKVVTQVSAETTLTVVASANHETQNTVQGATLAQINAHGWRFGLDDNPALQTYKGYNNASYRSSFDYVGVTSRLGDWDIDNKLYYNNFDHWANKTKDATDDNPADNGVTFYNAAGKKLGKSSTDVPGKQTDAQFHAFGDVLRLSRETGPGTLQLGAWFERNLDDRYSRPMDFSTGQTTGTKYGYAYNYQLADRTDTIQPYVQYDWHLTPSITVSPGLRYSRAERTLDATVNKSDTPAPLNAKATYDAWLPSISLHDALSPTWSAYAQLATGFLAPPIDVIYINGSQDLKPEQTRNLQLGTTYATGDLSFGADVYYIDFVNYIAETTITTANGNESLYVNGGGAIYKGVEVEATLALDKRWSVYANAAYNLATYKHSDVQVAATPKLTGTLGLIYGAKEGYFGSLMTKFTGSQYGLDNTTDASGNTVFANSQHLGGFTTADAALGYRSNSGPWGAKGYSISLDVNNLFDVHKLIAYAGSQSVSGTPLYFGLAGRGVFLDLSIKL